MRLYLTQRKSVFPTPADTAAMEHPTAMPELVVEPLRLPQARLAFPLMRQVLPALTLDGWLRFAGRVIRTSCQARTGILVARRSGSPRFCGAVCFRRDHDPHLGAVLTAEHLVALDLLHPQAVAAALVRALDGVAATLSCQVVRLIVLSGQPGVDRMLETYGHRSVGLILDRRACAQPAA